MKLVDLIRMIDEEDIITDSMELKDKETDCPYILSNNVYTLKLRFMAEEETSIRTICSHPILVPFYQAEVYGITPGDKDEIEVWIDAKDWFPCERCRAQRKEG